LSEDSAILKRRFDRGRDFETQPWLIVVGLAFLVPITGIISGAISSYLMRVRQAELEANLKQEMLQRGMSAEEIKTIIEATGRRKGKTCMPESTMHQDV
jgi:hypothetical protein